MYGIRLCLFKYREKEGQLKKMGDELRIDMSEEKGQLQKKKQQLYKQGDIYFSAKQR